MDLTLTAVIPHTGASADLRLTAQPGSPAAPLLAAIRRAVGVGPDTTLLHHDRPIAADGAVEDCGLTQGGVVFVDTAQPTRTPTAVEPTYELVVTAGPDAARRHLLRPGSQLVGRDPECEITIADRAVSRHQLRLDVADADAVTVTDLGSTNHTLLDGAPFGPDRPTTLATGSVLRVGDSEVRIERRRPPRSDDRVVYRSPRLEAAASTVEVVFPAPPGPPAPTRVPVLAAVAPLVAGLVLSVVLRQWQFLAFTALSPVMVLGQAMSDRRSSRRTHQAAQRDHRVATEQAQTRLAAALDAERRQRHRAAPGLADLTSAAIHRDPALWQRGRDDRDALTLRLGRGDVASAVRVIGGAGGATVGDVPVCVPLAELGMLGICGPRATTDGLVRSLVIQAATLHSPTDVRIVVLAAQRAQDWAWARWLPHVAAVGEPCQALLGFDRDQISARVRELLQVRSSAAATRMLVIVDGADEVRGSAAITALFSTRTDRTSIVWCAEQSSDLPRECRAIVSSTDAARPGLHLVTNDAMGQDVVPDLLAADLAETTARTLAAIRSGSSNERHDLPRSVRWAAVNPIDLRDREHAAESLVRAWARGPSTQVTLGCGGDGAVSVDLRSDGPHALIAGTTGAGKSELLMSLVAGLAAHNRPDQLSLLLIDHKGGAALGGFARLPHTVGVVTDLDSASTQRALQSLGAELRRRESKLAATGISDLEAYHASSPVEPLPRLVLVVDEFATLAEEHPDFVGGLVGIAQRGRSLGLHLVLATQRPDGAVSADIRANTRLRICLGVAREQESRDVIDCPDAASISRTTPGRAYLRIGPGDLRAFQTAQIGGTRTTPVGVTVTISPTATLGDPPSVPPIETDVTDLDVLIDGACDANRQWPSTQIAAPWLPPLPDDLTLSDLPHCAERTAVAWGLLDLPATGQQPPLILDAGSGGTTLVVGAARSGRTTAAVSMVTAVAARRSPDQMQVWGLDGAAGLAGLEWLPHCGAVIPMHDVDRTASLLGYLSDEVGRRRRTPDARAATLMLVIDSWEGLVSATDDRQGAALLDRVARLVADGPSAGLHTIITGERGLLTGRLAAAATERIVLRLADPADFVLIGMSSRDLPRHLPPGRAVRAADLSLLQVAKVDAATAEAACGWPPPAQRARRFQPLPDHVTLLALRADTNCGGDALFVGLEVDTLQPVTMSRSQLGCPFVVVGPSGSGRSTALLLVASQLTGRRLAVCAADGSPLAGCARAVRLPRDDQDHAVAILDSLRTGAGELPDVICDDVDLLPEGSLWARLDGMVRGSGSGAALVMAASPEAVASAFRGPLARCRRSRSGLLLGAVTSQDVEIFGPTVPRRSPSRLDHPPGRGWLVSSGSGRRVQLADPHEPGADSQPEELERSA